MAADIKSGDWISNYRALHKIGEGSVGEVWMAEQREPYRQRVALKVIKPGMDSAEVVARFAAESQALARMTHPGIAQVFDAGLTPSGRPYFAMESVDGLPIDRFCAHHRLSLEQRLELIAQVARAVHHAHQKGVMHRDLKPANILVATIEDEPVAKVIDFGVAKSILPDAADQTQLTQVGQLIGTPEYMSPEQVATSGGDIDIRSDVYSLGVVLYEIVTGRRPYTGLANGLVGLSTWLEKVRTTEPPRPSQLMAPEDVRAAGRFRRELDWVMLKALRSDRSERYDSAAALASDIERFLARESVRATPPGTRDRFRMLLARHRTGFAVASGVLVALLAGLAVAAVGFVQASRERDRAALARDEAEAVVGFLTNTLAAADPAGGSRDTTVVEALVQSAEQIEGAFPEQPLLEGRIRQTIGDTLVALGEYAQAEEHLRVALRLRREHLPGDHPETLRTANSLAGALFHQRRLQEAEVLYDEVLAGSAGDDEERRAGALNNLAQIRTLQDRIEEAEALQLEAYEIQQRVLGEVHEHTLGSLINLAEIRKYQGRPGEARALLQPALGEWIRVAGERHPGTLLAMNNLAGILLAAKDYEEAVRLYRRTATLRRDLLGPTHPDTLSAEHNLGITLVQMGQPEEGYRILERIILTQADRDAPFLQLETIVSLVTFYSAADWPEQSLSIFGELAAQLRTIGRTATDPGELNAAAWLLLQLPELSRDNLSMALEAVSRAVRTARETEDPRLWMLLDTMAMAQHLRGDSRAALVTQQEAIRLAPESATDSERAEMQEHLETYRAGVG